MVRLARVHLLNDTQLLQFFNGSLALDSFGLSWRVLPYFSHDGRIVRGLDPMDNLVLGSLSLE